MSYGALLQRIQKGLSTVELVHVPQPRWPLPPGQHNAPTVQVSVLDSSFNPPTLAHLALANIPPQTPTETAPTPAHFHDFDARLLLLSVRNADKQLKPGDATYEQRMEMMVLLARDLARTPSSVRSIPVAQAETSTLPPASSQTGDVTPPASVHVEHDSNVAVAIIDEPTFVGKSALLLDFLRARIADIQQHGPFPPTSGVVLPEQSGASAPPHPKLTFLMGTDTIVRLFAPRYYPDRQAMATALHRFLSSSEDDSRLICARRLTSTAGPRITAEQEQDVEAQLPVMVGDAALCSRIHFVDIGEQECTFSSSEVRERIASGDDGWRAMVTSSIASYIAEHGLYIRSPS